jgi:phage repressor protein C with HTH and peptisase S24 domain
MMYPPEMVGARLKELARAAGYPDLAKFARAAGVEPQTANKHALRDRIPVKTAEQYIAAAAATGADLQWLLTGHGTPPRILSALPKRPSGVRNRTIDTVTDRPQVSYTGEEISRVAQAGYIKEVPLPVRETLESGGSWMLTGRIIDEVARPSFMAPATEAFAFYLKSEDMDPRFQRGDRLLVNPSLPVVIDHDYIFLCAKDASGSQRGLVRRLLSFTDTHYRVKCYNPARVHNLARSEWLTAYRIEALRLRG